MKFRLVVLGLLLATGLAASVAAQVPGPRGRPDEQSTRRSLDMVFQRGDDPAWARPDYDDGAWTHISANDLPSRDGIYWVRFRLNVQEPSGGWSSDAVEFSVVASYEVFWDGRRIGRNGMVGGDREAEQPGFVDNVFRIPDELNAAGEHVVALRMSSFRTGFPLSTYGLNAGVLGLRDYLTFRAQAAAWSVVALGGALVVGIVFGLMWLMADRRLALLWFSGLCLSAAAMQALQAWRGLYDYRYDWHFPRLVAIAGVTIVVGLLLVAFLAAFFRARRAWLPVAVTAALMAAMWQVSPFYGAKAVFVCSCAFAVALAMATAAARQRKRGAGFVLAGLVVSCAGLLRSPGEFLEQSFFFSFGASMLGCVIALTLQLRDDRRGARAAQLTATRLELELLKKNLQPHFLLNTLSTIIEVIEQEPKLAVGLIEELAHEFRILARVAGEKLIPLGHELELCRAHLHVMSLRKGTRCVLDVAAGVNDRDLVPPALFHTLIENGLTHLLPREGEQRFELGAALTAGGVRYTLTAHGEPSDHERAPTFAPLNITLPPVAVAKPVVRREGTGLRYLKARLEESFPGCWTLDGGPIADGWRTIIEINRTRRAGARETGRPA